MLMNIKKDEKGTSFWLFPFQGDTLKLMSLFPENFNEISHFMKLKNPSALKLGNFSKTTRKERSNSGI